MVDYRVTFKGDLGNLAQFDAAIRNSVTASARAIEQANKGILSQVGAVSGIFNPQTSGAGLFTHNLKTQIDGINRTFIHQGDVIRRVLSDYEISVNKAGKASIKPVFTDQYQSSYKKAIGDLDAYEAALRKIAPTETKILNDRLSTLQRIEPLENRLSKLRQQQATETARRDSTAKALELQHIIPAQANLAQAQAAGSPASVIKALRAEVARLQAEAAKVLDPMNQDLAVTTQRIAALEAQINKIEASQLGRAAGLRSLNSGYGELDAAANATPPIQRQLAQVAKTSPDLIKRLRGLGLGGGFQEGTEDFKKALAQQEAAVTHYTENVRTNTKLVKGQWLDNVGKDATNIVKEFSVELDKNGKVVGRWGGQLAGAGTFLRQTVRDFQKVVEWTVATTVVFGSLATIVAQLRSINELNGLLARLSITAQTSATDTKKLFEDLGTVSIQTATPLKEIVKVADDIALATRRAGDSSEEWRSRIIDLTRAVGIFTNLTGVDTVQATDQLSAAFKQLNVAPSELVGILSKVTAVAGGQANAIADITKSLAGLAEAAKAAGFSVDEQIASIQVLSQVTNKSSDEIATSFKNLFGSVSSVGSEKILKEFGIQVRDASGGIRDFLDIYRDVKDALDKGIIPQNRLPDVLRGIAGGPRRAPDAAALLANLGRIDEVVGKSAAATNEALIANAKILDTNQAKIIQFQNAIDIAIFEKFGKAVEDITGNLATFATAITTAFNAIDASTISVIVQLGLFAVAAKGVVGILKLLGASAIFGPIIANLKNLVFEMKLAGAASTTTSGRLAEFINLQKGKGPGTGGIINTLKNNKGLIAGLGIAGAGAAVGLAGGGGLDTNTLGSALQLGGSIVALIPGLQAVGVGALVAGTALQVFAGDSNKAKDTLAATNAEIYTMVQNLQSLQTDVNNYTKAQNESKAVIDELRDKTGKTADEQARLITATQDYVTATLGLADANAKVNDSFNEILKTMPELLDKYQAFKQFAQSGVIPSGDLKKLQEDLAREILKNSGQAIFATNTLNRPISPTYVPPTYSGVGPNVQAVTGGQLDLSTLKNNPTAIDRLFRPDMGTSAEITAALKDGVNLAFAQSALAQLPDLIAKGQANGITEERLQQLTNAIQSLAETSSSFAANSIAITQQQAIIQSKIALGSFTQKQGQNATLANTLAGQLNAGATTYRPRTQGRDEPPDLTALQNAQKLIADLTNSANQGLSLTNDKLVEVAKTALLFNGTLDQLRAGGDEAINRGIYEWAKNAGVSVEQLDTLAIKLHLDFKQLADTSAEVAAAFDTARQNAQKTFADRSLQLLIAENSGQFEDNAKGLAILKAVNKEARDATLQLIDSVSTLSGTAMVDLNNALSQVIGLQGQYITDAQLAAMSDEDRIAAVTGLTQQLIDNAVAAGVNADGIKKITAEAAKLIAVVENIPAYKKIIIELEERIKAPGASDTRQGLLDEKALARAYQQQSKAEKAGTDPASIINKIIASINKTIASGTGSKIGTKSSSGGAKGSTAGSGPDVSQLDLPDEIANAANRSALIQEAVRRARALQKTIPGATKEASNDIVSLLKGTQNILNVRGVKDDLLRRALEELAEIEKKKLEFETKADTIRRIRIGAGDFSAIANVPVNTRTGISLGSPQGPINVTLNLNGTILTPAQMSQFADLVAASLKRQIAG